MKKAKFKVGDIVYIDNVIKETLFNKKNIFDTAIQAQEFANMYYGPLEHKLFNGIVKEVHTWPEIADKFFYVIHGIYMFQPELGSFDFFHSERYIFHTYRNTTNVLPVTHYIDYTKQTCIKSVVPE